MKQYAVKQLSKMAGVSVRTLHYYDQINLLKPSIRTTAGYRLYGEEELLRLQQILFYKELDFELKEIGSMLGDPQFDLMAALASHKQMLKKRRARINTLMSTIDQTISHLKNEEKMKHEDLYEGLPKEQAEAWSNEAKRRWPKQVEHATSELLTMSKTDFESLQVGFKSNWERLFSLRHLEPDSAEVQLEIDKHYAYILKFWGKTDNQAKAYKGLGNLYAADERYTQMHSAGQPEFGVFLKNAIDYYADTRVDE
jgi:DNA-binding transcriptional MerR regulator